VVWDQYDVDASPQWSSWLAWTTAHELHDDERGSAVFACSADRPFAPVERIDDPDGGGVGAIAIDLGTRFVASGPENIDVSDIGDDGAVLAPIASRTVGGFVREIRSSGFQQFFVEPSGVLRRWFVNEDASSQSSAALATGVDPAAPLDADDG